MRRLAAVIACSGALGAASAAGAGPLVQPGAPGAPARTINPEQSRRLGLTRPVPADVRFMQDMIMHHAQAVEMVGLLGGRTTNAALALFARRIADSQAAEIAIMRRWLTAHEAPESPHVHHGMIMKGMLSPDQMQALAAARGEAFERLFLQGMIQHHQGALDMAKALSAVPGAGEEPSLADFVVSIVSDQTSEILIMQSMLRAMPTSSSAITLGAMSL